MESQELGWHRTPVGDVYARENTLYYISFRCNVTYQDIMSHVTAIPTRQWRHNYDIMHHVDITSSSSVSRVILLYCYELRWWSSDWVDMWDYLAYLGYISATVEIFRPHWKYCFPGWIISASVEIGLPRSKYYTGVEIEKIQIYAISCHQLMVIL